MFPHEMGIYMVAVFVVPTVLGLLFMAAFNGYK